MAGIERNAEREALLDVMAALERQIPRLDGSRWQGAFIRWHAALARTARRRRLRSV